MHYRKGMVVPGRFTELRRHRTKSLLAVGFSLIVTIQLLHLQACISCRKGLEGRRTIPKSEKQNLICTPDTTPLSTPADCCFCFTGPDVVLDAPERANRFIFGATAVSSNTGALQETMAMAGNRPRLFHRLSSSELSKIKPQKA